MCTVTQFAQSYWMVARHEARFKRITQNDATGINIWTGIPILVKNADKHKCLNSVNINNEKNSLPSIYILDEQTNIHAPTYKKKRTNYI